MMADCTGTVPVGTKTDREMSEYVEQRANELGVSKSELLRRLLDHYRDSRTGEHVCPYCERSIRITL